ncbi:MAG: endopeptidase La [Alphaproteobacteria bacterium]
MSEENKVTSENTIHTIPLLPLRDIVVFPHMAVPLFVGRDKSIKALEEVIEKDREVFLVAQKDPTTDDPNIDDVYHVGTVARIMQLLRLPDGTVKVLVEGKTRGKIIKVADNADYMTVDIEYLNDIDGENDVDDLVEELKNKFEQYVRLGKKVAPEILSNIKSIADHSILADTIASHLAQDVIHKQQILETINVEDRVSVTIEKIDEDIDVFQVEKKIRGRVKRSMEKTQREYYLNEQMKAIQQELNDGEEDNEIAEIEKKIEATELSKEAKDKAYSELKKMKTMSPMSAETTVVRNYLDWLLDIPWKKRSKVEKTLQQAEEILDRDHYGLDKVKERILEYLAVQQRSEKVRGPILCLVGPPGVGKTSLGQSIAEAAGRKFVRMSLGGVRDEAEIRGHRRTYIGSQPGKIVQSIKKAKVSNPMFLFDEIDKMGQDFRGDPASALLEVLDPEQNSTFMDHYLEVEYDLSDVMFIATANSLNLPAPLLDRMEIIHLSGYTEQEKLEIAKRHIVKKQMDMNGIKEEEWSIADEAIVDLIRYYTRESGVRGLERDIAKIIRKSLKEILLGNTDHVHVTSENLSNYAGVRKFRFGIAEERDQVGVTTGLAWTSVGGELLSIEAVELKGKGNMKLTGKLGEVMQESIQTARSYVHSRANQYGISFNKFEEKDIHLHVPEGATPKDGPSAGVAMVTSIVSVLTNNPVRKDIAMTGEVTLRGNVLPIGGLKEKLLAALRGGIKTVFIPKENEKDMAEIPDNVKEGLEIIFADHVDTVLEGALVNELIPINELEVAKNKDVDINNPTAHH